MNHFSFQLSLVAVIPAIILCGYVFYKDRIEREPIGLLALLFGAGALGYIPACIIQNLICGGIDKAFSGFVSFSAEGGAVYGSEGAELAHLSLISLAGLSVVQTALQWGLLFLITHKNKNFNYLFDGIVYSTFLSLGFALAENLHFALLNNIELLGAKILTSVPCHLFIGILMGYYYTMWNMRFKANGIENRMLAEGVVKQDKIRSSAVWLIAGLVIPMLLRSVYLLAGSLKNSTVTFVFYFAVIALYGISFIFINSMAAKDCKTESYLCKVIAKGHSDLPVERIIQIVSKAERGEEEQ